MTALPDQHKPTLTCYYCRSSALRITHRGEVHKVDRSFGPFDIFICDQCGSMGTANPPSTERLAQFYRQYDDFRPDWYKSGSAAGALASQYRFYAQHVFQESGSWADVGAGHGEVANSITTRNSDGTAIEIGPRPTDLSSAVDYIGIDMNRAGWAKAIGRQFDNVFSIAVWEHVLSPADFAYECLSLVAPGGRLTLVTPDYGSFARRVLGRSWPYFEPGEHISIPSRDGARHCLESACDALKIEARVVVKPLAVRYSIRYALDVLRLRSLSAMLPPDFAAPLPTGILSARVHKA